MALPSGYKKLKYIESDGNQWCSIGVNGQSGISVEAKITWNAGRVFIGSTTADDKTRCFPTFKYGNGNYFGYGYITTYQASKAVVHGNDYTIETDFTVGAQSMKVNGEVIKTTANTTSFNNGFPLCLFAANFGGTIQDQGSFRCEYCKVRLNGTLVSDLTPCQNPSGVAGLWDDASGVFRGSEGSKPFIAGPVIDPMAPNDGHNTNIGNIAREIESGTVLIGGVGREFKKGTVRISGVLRELVLKTDIFTITTTGKLGGYCKVTADGTSLTAGKTYEVEEDTQITVVVSSDYAANTLPGRIYLNGTLFDSRNYTFPVTSNVTIEGLDNYTSYLGGGFWGQANITTE